MSSLVDVQNQIEKLQKLANDIKAKEFDKTVQDILAKMQAFGITPKDLQSRSSRTGKSSTKPASKVGRKKAGKISGTTIAAKYRGPDGETWSGRGLSPRWLTALMAAGKKKEDFVIKN